MKTTDAQLRQIGTWFAEKCPAFRCVQCGHRGMFDTQHIVMAPEYVPGASLAAGEVVPLLQMICVNCGHVSFFSAVVMGLVPGR